MPLKFYLVAGVAALLLAGLWYYGHTRYLEGVEHAKTEIVKDIANSKDLKDAEARKASAAASAAARRVCEQAGLPFDACQDF